MNRRIKMEWIVIAVIMFSVLHYMIIYISSNLSISVDYYQEAISWLNIAALSLYFLCGMFASIFQRKRFIAIGLVVGFVSALNAVLLFNVANGDVNGIFITVITGLILGSLGGTFSMLINRWRTNAL